MNPSRRKDDGFGENPPALSPISSYSIQTPCKYELHTFASEALCHIKVDSAVLISQAYQPSIVRMTVQQAARGCKVSSFCNYDATRLSLKGSPLTQQINPALECKDIKDRAVNLL